MEEKEQPEEKQTFLLSFHSEEKNEEISNLDELQKELLNQKSNFSGLEKIPEQFSSIYARKQEQIARQKNLMNLHMKAKEHQNSLQNAEENFSEKKALLTNKKEQLKLPHIIPESFTNHIERIKKKSQQIDNEFLSKKNNLDQKE